MEFKKHRQAAILEGFKALKGPDSIPRPGLFSDAKSGVALQRDIKNAEKRVNRLKDRLRRALYKPANNDPVYKVFQRCYHKADVLSLTRDSEMKSTIRRRAFRRYLTGCPPRKSGDTSIGDAINWEWLVHCAINEEAEIHIASRDSDYGVTFEGRAYLNDHLLQEFRERVSKKRGIYLHSRLSEALKKFAVAVTPEEEKEEEDSGKWHISPEESGKALMKWFELLKDAEFSKDKLSPFEPPKPS